MKKLLLFTLINLLYFPLSIHAMNVKTSVGDKVPGYVVLDNGKKIQGRIVIGSIIDNELTIGFIPEGRSKKTVYTPKEIRAYAYQFVEIDEMGQKSMNWIRYDRQKTNIPPRALAATTVFMQREAEGVLDLYSYFVEVNNNGAISYQYHYYIANEDEQLQHVDKQSFDRMSRQLFQGYTALQSKIGQGDLNFRHLDQIVRDFNFWMINQHDKNEYRMAHKHQDEFMDDAIWEDQY